MLKAESIPDSGAMPLPTIDPQPIAIDLARSDSARDAINILALSIIPLQTARLKRARLLKNVRLESAVEIFTNEGGGSGHIECSQLHKFFSWPEGVKHPDQQMMAKLGALRSYDVFSLRGALRRLGIEVNDLAALQLSDRKKTELTGYMKRFTAPLIQQIYGSQETEVRDFDQLVGMFKHPDKEAALRNLRLLAEKLRIELMEVPQFLEDYADVFLSLAYFQELFSTLLPLINSFLDQLQRLLATQKFKQDYVFVRDAAVLETALGHIQAAVASRFDNFNLSTKNMWDDISAESFRRVRKMITAQHATIGGMLCGLSVKMQGWETTFEGQSIGQQQRKRVHFIQAEMLPGISMVEALDLTAG